MSTIEHAVDVRVPIRTAYDQWTRFESFPAFMEGVESVERLDDTRTAWSVTIGGVHREFEAEITERHPEERVAWRSLEPPRQSGVVTFHRIDDDLTRVRLQMEYDPEGLVERAGDALQFVRLRVKGDLERFKEFIESRDGATGGWRGEAPGPHRRPGGTGAGPDLGESRPPRLVAGDHPGDTPLPPPGGGPVPPAGAPRWDDEPPAGPRHPR